MQTGVRLKTLRQSRESSDTFSRCVEMNRNQWLPGTAEKLNMDVEVKNDMTK